MAERKQIFGQFFTRHPQVHTSMLRLLSHTSGRALEPAAGQGHLVAALERDRPGLQVDAVELDGTLTSVCATPVVQQDFFDWADGRDGTYRVVFGNPPYVAWGRASAGTRRAAAEVQRRYPAKTNLYHLFIDRCIDLLAPGGELVFIVPKEWLYATSAAPLRSKMADLGAVVDLIDCGEERLFDDAAVPSLLIFRYVRGARTDRVRYYGSLGQHLRQEPARRRLRRTGTRWALLTDDLAARTASWGRLGDTIDVRVGLVTGYDAAFRVPDGQLTSTSCLQRQVTTSRQAETFINANHVASEADLPADVRAHLLPFKPRLLARRIARFDESNWWQYGAVRNAAAMASPTPRLYGHAKTRRRDPFFQHPVRHFSGGILGLFLRPPWDGSHLADLTALLNSQTVRALFAGMFLMVDDKVSLQPATLADLPLPSDPAALAAALHPSGGQTATVTRVAGAGGLHPTVGRR